MDLLETIKNIHNLPYPIQNAYFQAHFVSLGGDHEQSISNHTHDLNILLYSTHNAALKGDLKRYNLGVMEKHLRF